MASVGKHALTRLRIGEQDRGLEKYSNSDLTRNRVVSTTQDMENASPALKVEVLKALPTGTRVRLPDGDVGVVNWSSYAEVHVVHPGRMVGAGPWIFARHQVEPVVAG